MEKLGYFHLAELTEMILAVLKHEPKLPLMLPGSIILSDSHKHSVGLGWAS